MNLIMIKWPIETGRQLRFINHLLYVAALYFQLEETVTCNKWICCKEDVIYRSSEK